MPLISQLVKKVKTLCGEEQAVHIVYEDQPTNDFKSLFMRLNGETCLSTYWKFPCIHLACKVIV